MKPITQKHLLALFGAALLGFGGVASAAIVDSLHDLSSLSASGGNTVTESDDTCVFCHTPHAAASNTVPLWNKQLPATVYTSYSSTTMDGAVDMTGSTSIACLSCHDGTQAMDNIVNTPGSGTVANASQATGQGWTWSNVPAGTDAEGRLAAGVITNLGTDLGDDHPIAIPYGGGGLTAAAGTDTTTDPDFRGVGDTVTVNAETYTVSRANIGGQSVVWFEDSTANGRIDSSEIRLYTVSGKTNPQVECASCHDPHKGENTTFLRIANTQSAVCVTCHVK